MASPASARDFAQPARRRYPVLVRARPPHHRAWGFLLATLAALVGSSSWAQSGGIGDIHVLLRGEDESALAPLPIARDAPFELPRFDPVADLRELIRNPVSSRAPEPGVVRGVDAGPAPTEAETGAATAEVTPDRFASSGASGPERGAGDRGDLPPAVPPSGETGAATAGGTADAAAEGTAGSAAGGTAMPPAGPEAARLGAPGSSAVITSGAAAPIGLPPGLPIEPVPGAAPPIPASPLGASLEIRYRPGHRLLTAVSGGLRLPAVEASADLRLLVSDDLVPSLLASRSGGAASVSLELTPPALPLTAGLDASFMLWAGAGGVEAGSVLASLEGGLDSGGLRIHIGSSLAGMDLFTGSPSALLRPQATFRVSVSDLVALRLGVAADLAGPSGAWSGDGTAAVELGFLRDRAGRAGLSVAAGAGVRLGSGSPQVLPVFELQARLRLLEVSASLGPFVAYPAPLEHLLLELRSGPRAAEPERGLAAALVASFDPSDALSLGVSARYASGLLSTISEGRYALERSSRLWLELRGRLAGAATLSFAVAPVVSLGGDGAVELLEMLSTAAVGLGFWRIELAAILHPGAALPSSPGAGEPSLLGEALDAVPGYGLGLRIERSLGGSSSAGAELRVHVEPGWEAATVSAQVGVRIGVP